MPTYYKYEPRDSKAQINWAKAAAGVSKVVEDEANDRIARKAEIEDSTRKLIDKMGKPVSGENTSIREVGIDFGQTAQELMMTQNKLLKSGQLSVADYTKFKQNMNDGTDKVLSLQKEYQDIYAEKMARFNEADPAKQAAGLEQWLMENAEGFSDLRNIEIVINPKTGKIMAGKKVFNEKKGIMEISTNPNDLVSVDSLSGQILGKYDKYNVEAQTKSFVDNLGKITSVSREVGSRTKAGTILTTISKLPTKYDDKGKRIMKTVTPDLAKQFGLTEEATSAINAHIKTLDYWIEGQMANPISMGTVLHDYVKTSGSDEYTHTFDVEEAKKDSKFILLKRSPNGIIPVFDEDVNPNARKQKEDINDYMKYSVFSKSDESSSIQTFNDWKAPAADAKWKYDAREKKKNENELVQLWNKLGNAPASQKQEIANGIIGTKAAKAQGLSVVFSPDGTKVSFLYSDATKNRNNVDVPETADGWVALGSEVHGQQGKSAGNGFDSKNYNTGGFNNVSSNRQGTPADNVFAKFENTASQVASDLPDFNQNPKNIKTSIQTAVAKLGGNVSIDKGKLIVTNKDGQTYTVATKGGEDEKKALMSFLTNVSKKAKISVNERTPNRANSDKSKTGEEKLAERRAKIAGK